MKSHLKFHLDSLKPWDVTEKMDKEETAQWAFEQGYLYRKKCELVGKDRLAKLGELKNRLLPLDWIQKTLDQNENTNNLDKLIGKFPVTSEVLPDNGFNPKEVIFDEAAHITPEQWDEINETMKKMGKAARKVVDNIADESGIDKTLIYNEQGGLRLPSRPFLPEGADKVSDERRAQFFGDLKKEIFKSDFGEMELRAIADMFQERAFLFNEISMKLFDAKFRGIIDGEQLNKLLDYFDENKKEEDEN